MEVGMIRKYRQRDFAFGQKYVMEGATKLEKYANREFLKDLASTCGIRYFGDIDSATNTFVAVTEEHVDDYCRQKNLLDISEASVEEFKKAKTNLIVAYFKDAVKFGEELKQQIMADIKNKLA